MRDIFADIFDLEPPDPMEAARRGMRPPLRARFYQDVQVGKAGEAGKAGVAGEGFAILLDGKPVRTPARRLLAAPARELAEAIAAEWRAQGDVIEPARMPLTRLANAIIDGVAAVPQPVKAAIAKYLATDLLLYRASGPEGLTARQAQFWDPVLAWAREALGARFRLIAGVMHVAQPSAAIAAAAAAIPGAEGQARELWRLGALNVVTTLTGSALLALALAAGRIDADTAWAAAHVDEDWNMEFWGRDERARAPRLPFRRAAGGGIGAVAAAVNVGGADSGNVRAAKLAGERSGLASTGIAAGIIVSEGRSICWSGHPSTRFASTSIDERDSFLCRPQRRCGRPFLRNRKYRP
jgi:chaperone required for assembly of F1-ATPase